LGDITALPPANMDSLVRKALIKNCKYMKLAKLDTNSELTVLEVCVWQGFVSTDFFK
jgi:hypothetical protein